LEGVRGALGGTSDFPRNADAPKVEKQERRDNPVRRYAAVLGRVAEGLAWLTKPTPDKLEQLAGELAAARAETLSLGIADIPDLLANAESAVRTMLLGDVSVHDDCVHAMERIAEWLVNALVSRALSPQQLRESRLDLERKVLIVDDSRVAAVALSNAFSAREFLVRAVATMEEALSELRSFRPTVLVSDVHMPQLDVGILCRTFRELSQGRPVLVILVSGMSESAVEDRIIQIEHDAFVPKMAGARAVVERTLELWRGLNAAASK